MAVDRENLISQISQHGTIEYCDVYDEKSWLIIVNNWNSDETVFESIINQYLIQDYPVKVTLTLDSGVLKSQYEIV